MSWNIQKDILDTETKEIILKTNDYNLPKELEEPSKYIIFESILLDDLNDRQSILVGLLNVAKKHGYAYLKNVTICELLKASGKQYKK